jgi:hypothetical protein
VAVYTVKEHSLIKISTRDTQKGMWRELSRSSRMRRMSELLDAIVPGTGDSDREARVLNINEHRGAVRCKGGAREL